jgi:tRNA(Ile2) C34 agmatinyltransferase TiaS
VQEGVVSGALALAPHPPDPAGGRRPSLEERLAEVLERTRANLDPDCPVCGAAMELFGEGARCAGCASILA